MYGSSLEKKDGECWRCVRQNQQTGDGSVLHSGMITENQAQRLEAGLYAYNL
jgi:hypothetical protein